MTVYILLFLLGFMLAVCMLAYASIQVAELNKKTEQFSKNLRERYSKPIAGIDDAKKEAEKENTENTVNTGNAINTENAENGKKG